VTEDLGHARYARGAAPPIAVTGGVKASATPPSTFVVVTVVPGAYIRHISPFLQHPTPEDRHRQMFTKPGLRKPLFVFRGLSPFESDAEFMAARAGLPSAGRRR
jgi:hypothetical protein